MSPQQNTPPLALRIGSNRPEVWILRKAAGLTKAVTRAMVFLPDLPGASVFVEYCLGNLLGGRQPANSVCLACVSCFCVYWFVSLD